MAREEKPAPRQKRVLARPLWQAGSLREPGETVELRPEQIARLEGEGYFEPAARAHGDRGEKS